MNWIKVSDGLPKMKPMYQDGPQSSETVIVFTGSVVTIGHLQETYKRRTVKWKGMHSDIPVTHWMPMPSAPTS